MPSELPLDEKIVRLTDALCAADIPHAFGGALALAYHGEPRATIDIDINVFMVPESAGPALDVLTQIGVRMRRDDVSAEIERQGQVRVLWGRTPLDLFFDVHPFHHACAAGRRAVPFGETQIPILAAEHLAVFKALYDRRKDWIDLEQMVFLAGPTFDAGEALGWLGKLIGADDPRTQRLETVIREFGG